MGPVDSNLKLGCMVISNEENICGRKKMVGEGSRVKWHYS